jgi:YD repeat-containing protein
VVGRTYSQWRETRLDNRGNATSVKDSTGLQTHFTYDSSGELVSAVKQTSEGKVEVNVGRDTQGRLSAVTSPWANISYEYTADGDLQCVQTQCGEANATTELADGLLRHVVGFDGGHTEFVYNDEGDSQSTLRSLTCANALELRPDYAAGRRLSSVKVGQERRVKLKYDDKNRVVGYSVERLI